MCGLPGAGKTTRAKEIERERNAIRFTPDEWITRMGIDPFDEPFREKLEQLHADLALQILSRGVDVILDFGFWSREERDEQRARAAAMGADTRVVFMEASREELLTRLERRRISDVPSEIAASPEQLDSYIALLQPPDVDEL